MNEETLRLIGETITWLFSVGMAVIGIYKWIAKPLKAMLGKYDNIQIGVALIIKIKIEDLYDEIMIQDFVLIDQLEKFCDLYHQYKRMGFNHIRDNMLEDVERLPIKKYKHDVKKCDYELYK